jgi:AAA15 family ATPase/GTPase
MLIEFSVENYLCFKNETTFSFEAMTDLDDTKYFNPESRRVLEGVLDPETGEPIVINTVNAIYGKNASGKSTFLRSIMKLFSLIMGSRKLNDDDDFSLDYSDPSKPIIFKITFVHDKNVYLYEIRLIGEDKNACVLYEQLQKKSTKELLFQRDGKNITSESFLNSEQIESLTEDLPKNHFLFSYPFGKLKPLRETFSQSNNDTMDVRPLSRSKHPFASVRTLSVLDVGLFPERLKEKLESEEWKKDLLIQLQEADFDIIDYELKLFEEDLYHIYFTTKEGKKRTFREQSDGTKKFFILLVDIKDGILENGGMYVVDELEKALHPKLALRFINIFKSRETNKKNARLLFTTHDTGFMHQSILNGDQVWFIERNDETQETKLYSPAEKNNFNALHLQGDYMHGQYGAVPKTEG